MKSVTAIVVGAGWGLDVKIEGDQTVGELKAKLRDSRKKFLCMIDDMNLYLAKRNGKWLRWYHRDVQRLLKGEVPERVKALMTEDNKLDPERSLRDLGFPDLEHADFKQIGVLLEYPESITRRFYTTMHRPAHSAQSLSCGIPEALEATYKWLGSLFNATRVAVMRPKTV